MRPSLLLSALLLISSITLQHAQAAATVADGGPTDLPAPDRGLTATDIKASLLVQEGNKYYKAVEQKVFKGRVLGYVTPWNSHGYEVAKRWRAKFSHISPVWYQLRAKEGGAGGFQLTGGHDVDQGWIAALREPVDDTQCADDAGAASTQTCSADNTGTSRVPPLIVPRVIFELAPSDLVKVLEAPGDVIGMIAEEVKQQGLDGVVVEGWLQWAAMGALQQEAVRQAIIALVVKLAAALQAAGKVLVLAVPPVVPSQPGRPGAELEHMQQLAAAVDGFSIMLYDYSAAGGSPGPNAPLAWQEENVRHLLSAAVESQSGGAGSQVSPEQVLMGVPFYGYDHSRPDTPSSSSGSSKKRAAAAPAATASPIMGPAFLSVLRKLKPKLKWEAQHAEHKIKYKDGGLRHTVYYPTPAGLAARTQLAEQLGVGLSIWDLGQAEGLDSLLDLL